MAGSRRPALAAETLQPVGPWVSVPELPALLAAASSPLLARARFGAASCWGHIVTCPHGPQHRAGKSTARCLQWAPCVRAPLSGGRPWAARSGPVLGRAAWAQRPAPGGAAELLKHGVPVQQPCAWGGREGSVR